MGAPETPIEHHQSLLTLSVWSFFNHLHLDKMAAILADDIFNCIFFNENDRITIQISLKFVLMRPIGNTPALVQVIMGIMGIRYFEQYFPTQAKLNRTLWNVMMKFCSGVIYKMVFIFVIICTVSQFV